MSTDPLASLYPHLAGLGRPESALGAQAALVASTMAKIDESVAVRERTLVEHAEVIERLAIAAGERIGMGGRVVAFGNGGSSSDAGLCVEIARRLGLAAINLAEDPAPLTAFANDLGVEFVFARAVDALVSARDVVVAFSTSGGSANVLEGLRRAVARGALAIGLAGYGAGRMAALEGLAGCISVPSESVHRIQEAQSACAAALLVRIRREQERAGRHG